MVRLVEPHRHRALTLGDRPTGDHFAFVSVHHINLTLAMASSVSPSILISASFLPEVVSTTLSMEYVWWTSPPPLSMYRYLVVGSYPIESASSSSFTLDSRVYVLPSNILRSPASPSVTYMRLRSSR